MAAESDSMRCRVAMCEHVMPQMEPSIATSVVAKTAESPL